MDQDWHTGHFACWNCNMSLTGHRYILREEHPFCIKCYENLFANTCEDCKTPIGTDSKVRNEHFLFKGALSQWFECALVKHLLFSATGEQWLVKSIHQVRRFQSWRLDVRRKASALPFESHVGPSTCLRLGIILFTWGLNQAIEKRYFSWRIQSMHWMMILDLRPGQLRLTIACTS